MGALWRAVAPARQLAPALDAERLAAFIDAAPGLAIEDYLVARRADGRIAGFLALWDQRLLKQLRVLGYSRRLSRRAHRTQRDRAGWPERRVFPDAGTCPAIARRTPPLRPGHRARGASRAAAARLRGPSSDGSPLPHARARPS